MRKHRKITITITLLAKTWKQLSVETNKYPCEAKKIPLEFSAVSTETNSTSHQHSFAAYEAKKALYRPKIASAKAIWIAKSDLVISEAKEKSLDKASCEANSALCRVQLYLSREAKAKAPLYADSVADVASPPLPALSAKKVLSRKARTKALFSTNDLICEAKNEAPLSARSEAISISLKERAMLRKVKLSFKGKAKTVTSPCEANSSGEAILASSTAKKATFKARPRAFQPKQANSQLLRVSVLIG